MKIYQIGGAVRDKLLGITSSDIDYIVVGSSINEMLSQDYIQVGRSFPVFINPHNKCEYALARKEIKTGPKHTDFEFIFTPDITLEEDVLRRDFTCNALAYDEETSQIIDFHNGINDIKLKILRHINSEHFIEDPLRVLRMCRFAAQLNFSIAPETMTLAQNMVKSDMLSYLSPERIWQEILKALKSPNFGQFIIAAKNCGALDKILPEIQQLFSVPERPHYHPEKNTGAHTLLALEQASNQPIHTKLAILFHDIGKTQTPVCNLPNHQGHDKIGPALIKQIAKRLPIPKQMIKFAIISCQYHCKFDFIFDLSPDELTDFALNFSQSNLDDFIEVCRADFYGRQIILNENDHQLFAKKESFLRQSIKILQSIKSHDIPNFENLKKDASFKQKLFNFKSEIIKNKLF